MSLYVICKEGMILLLIIYIIGLFLTYIILFKNLCKRFKEKCNNTNFDESTDFDQLCILFQTLVWPISLIAFFVILPFDIINSKIKKQVGIK